VTSDVVLLAMINEHHSAGTLSMFPCWALCKAKFSARVTAGCVSSRRYCRQSRSGSRGLCSVAVTDDFDFDQKGIRSELEIA